MSGFDFRQANTQSQSACCYCCLSLQAQANSTSPLRFWLDEFAFTPGETTLLKEEIEVCIKAFMQR